LPARPPPQSCSAVCIVSESTIGLWLDM
jgi:hypothetical protein